MLKSSSRSTGSKSANGAEFVRQLPENWLRTDTILAVVVAFVSVLSLQALRLTTILEDTNVDIVTAQVFSLAISALLVLYRRYPVIIVTVFTALIFVGSLTAASELYSLLFVGFMTIYSVGAWVSNRRVAFWVRFAVVSLQLLGSMLLVLLDDETAEVSEEALRDIDTSEILYFLVTSVILSFGFYLSACYFGGQAWHRAKQRWKLQKAHDELAEANEKVADAAVHAERIHIARELHDVTAHHVTVMGVHASAARRLLEAGRDQASVIEQLEHIESSSAQAVQELQTMVYTLRDQDGSSEPLPDLSQLPQLVEQANSARQSASFQVLGEPAEVTAATELTLYRVAQEALSNARRHAGEDVTVQVQLHYDGSAVTLSVIDDGKAYHPDSNGTGTGIQGMKERVRAVDGTLEYGPRTPYGWKVVVCVPCAAPNES
ncbi:sensor histidine kinase [Yaniella halotolerans]|uniref:sensor histidine kinase n=1 Tax=Yaniella halotolerans TaxID=225453 RepID=UPI0003B30D09|nr:sensor histidine kinase [Yaniella halotolerans]